MQPSSKDWAGGGCSGKHLRRIILLKYQILRYPRIVAIVVGFCFVLMFLFVPETFWDRTPRPRSKSRRTALANISKIFSHDSHHEAQDEKQAAHTGGDGSLDLRKLAIGNSATATAGTGRATIAERRMQKHTQHVGFADQAEVASDDMQTERRIEPEISDEGEVLHLTPPNNGQGSPRPLSLASHEHASSVEPRGEGPQTPDLHNFNSPFYVTKEKSNSDYLSNEHVDAEATPETPGSTNTEPATAALSEKPGGSRYTHLLRNQPPKTYIETLKPWNGRLRHENWLLVAIRPFILFAYPSILWSTLVYSLSIGWLIVISESVSTIYENKASYNFTALQTGLIYISPFVGGVLGTAVAGKISDIIVRWMARRNGGIYEPEFRLVMAIPVAISTCIGLMGFGWSAQEKDKWIVPTVFFGIISFGCALGSTTSITFAVDSYRQYAGEALVTLNFSKSESSLADIVALTDPWSLDIFHGLVFSLFFNKWLDSDGSKNTFVGIGVIQLICLATTVPMYVYGKRARMWTVRKNFMERF